MSNEKPNDICENCKHSARISEHSECRKYAPRGGSKWPTVSKQDWCSEFEQKSDGPSHKVIGEMQNSIG